MTMNPSREPLPCDLLLEGGTVVTLDPAQPVIEDGFVAITRDRILAVGTAAEASHYAAGRVVSCRDKIVMPGLVDCHNHLFQALGRTHGEGLTGWEWLSTFMWPYAAQITQEETIAAVYLGAVEAVLAGTTSILDHHYGRTDEPTTLAVAAAVEDVGLRGSVARGLAGSHTPLAKRQGLPASAFPIPAAEELAITEACIQARPAGSKVEIWPGPINTVYTDQDLLAASVQLARSHDVGWTTHLSAPQSDPDVYREAYGVRPAIWLRDEGLLGPDAVLSHATWIDEEEIAALGATHTAIAHCPTSNQIVPYGVMPMRQLLDAGATIGLGTDGSTIGHRQDLFENMKMLVLMHRLADMDPKATTANEALEIGTRGGAAALGIDSGRLSPGALADVIVLGTDKAHLTPLHRPEAGIVYAARSSDVTMNIIGGEVVVENGRTILVDQDEVLAEATSRASDLMSRIGLAHRP